MLEGLVEAKWIPLAQRDPLYQRILEIRQDKLKTLQGYEAEWAQRPLWEWQVRWLRHLIVTRQYERASAVLESLPQETRDAQAHDLIPLRLRIAAETKTLDAVLDGYRADPQRIPDLGFLRNAAAELQKAGDKSSARKILEFVFARDIEERRLSAASFIGLAEIRLDSGDTAGGLELLRRMTLVVGEPFQNLDSAAALLEKTAHPAEAAGFLDQLVSAVPWNPGYRVRLAQALIAAGKDVASARGSLEAIAANRAASYEIRVQAASTLPGSKVSADLGSAELRLLATAGSIAGDNANQPLFYPARLAAGRRADIGGAGLPILRTAIEDYPRRDAARITFFGGAVRAQQYQLAYSALAPLLRGGFLLRENRDSRYRVEEENASEESADSQADETPTRITPPATLTRIPRAEQAAIASNLAAVLEHLNRLNEATQYLQLAIRLEAAPAGRTALRRRLAGLRVIIKRRADNAARRPIIHDALEQDRTVRPQLIAQAGSPAEKTAAPPAKSPEKERRQP